MSHDQAAIDSAGRGYDAGAESHHAHHVLPVSTYLAIFGALLVLTGITVGVSYLNLGDAAIFVALIVALIKAALVAGYFMHLKFDNRFLTLVFTGSVLFLAIFFFLTFIDVKTRGEVQPIQDNFARVAEEEAQRRLKAAEEKKAAEQATQAKPAEPKAGEPKAGETKPAEPKAVEPKAGETKPAEPKAGETKAGETKAGETKAGETKPAETKPAEPKAVEPKTDPKAGEPKPETK